MRRDPRYSLHAGYESRLLGCLATSLLLLIAAFRWWPFSGTEPDAGLAYQAREQEVIRLEEIQPTRQMLRLKPPPPVPLPPVVVPDDVILEQEELEIVDSYLALSGPPGEAPAPQGGPVGTTPVEEEVLVGPKPVRFVEPEYSREARRRRVRAEIIVEVLVDEKGHVKDTRVVERYLLGKENESKEAVATLGYGLEEAAVAAAERWQFRPARKNGRPVPSHTTLTFRFGV